MLESSVCKEGILRFMFSRLCLCRAVPVRFFVLFLLMGKVFDMVSAPAQPPILPKPSLNIPNIIEEERRRLEAARAAANKPPRPEAIGPPLPRPEPIGPDFLVEAIEENRTLLRSWVAAAQTAEKEGRLKDAVAMYRFGFSKMHQDEVMEFMPAAEVRPLAEGLSRIQLQKARDAMQARDYDEAVIAITELEAWMPEVESTEVFMAQAADLKRQVEKARSTIKQGSPSRDTITRLSEIRGNKREIDRLLRDGMILYDAKDYETAYPYFERVIYLDPLNDRAEHYLKRIHRMRILVTDKRREQLFREKVNEVNQMWIDDNRRHNLPVPNPYYRGPKGLNIDTLPTGGGAGGIMPKFQSSVQPNLGAAKIHQKLSTIRVPEIKPLNGLTLLEVVNLLDQAVRDADPERQGVNFRINTTIPWNLRQPQFQADGPRPRVNDNGLPVLPDIKSDDSVSRETDSAEASVKRAPKTMVHVTEASKEVVDPEGIIIRGLTTPLRELTVGELLEAISDSFSVPIKHEVSGFGVTFSYRGPEVEEQFTRTFKVNPHTFLQGLGVPTANLDGFKAPGIVLTPVKPQDFGHPTPGSVGMNPMMNGNVQMPRVQMPNVQSTNGGIYQKQVNGNDDRVYYGIAPPGGGGAPGCGGAPGGGAPGGGQGLLQATAASQAIENLLRNTYQLNVRVFFNDRRGIMLVRGPLSDLDMVEQILDVFNASPPQVKMEAKYAEIEYDTNQALGFDWFLGNSRLLGDKVIAAPGTAPTYIGEPSRNNPSGFFPYPGTLQVDQFVPSPNSIRPRSTDGHITSNMKQHGNPMLTLTGILTDPQFRMVLSAMDQNEGVQVLSSPSIITVSGRPAQLNVQDQRYLVTGVTPAFTPGMMGGGAGAMMPNISSSNFGPQFSAVPYVSSDMYTINMTVQPTFTEFLGYEDTTFEATAFAGGNVVTQPIALPKMRTRTMNVECVVWDGYTVGLGGLIAESVLHTKDKVPFLGDAPFIGGLFRGESTARKNKNMHIFITSTIIDPAGNPVNVEETLPFYRQPEGEVPNFRGLQP